MGGYIYAFSESVRILMIEERLEKTYRRDGREAVK